MQTTNNADMIGLGHNSEVSELHFPVEGKA